MGIVREWMEYDEQLTLWLPRFNIAPTQNVLAIRHDEQGGRYLFAPRWGLVPSWAKDEKVGSRMINARSETAAEKPSFRTALIKRRCLIPATHFYEWKRDGDARQPHCITMADEQLFTFAGLWESWVDPEGQNLDTCTILTCAPNALMKTLHDRMPVIIQPEDHDRWLSEGPGDLMSPYPDGLMQEWEVSKLVNSPRNDSAACIEPERGLYG